MAQKLIRYQKPYPMSLFILLGILNANWIISQDELDNISEEYQQQIMTEIFGDMEQTETSEEETKHNNVQNKKNDKKKSTPTKNKAKSKDNKTSSPTKEKAKSKNNTNKKSTIDKKYLDLNKLKKLLDKEIITKEEFEKEKKKNIE